MSHMHLLLARPHYCPVLLAVRVAMHEKLCYVLVICWISILSQLKGLAFCSTDVRGFAGRSDISSNDATKACLMYP